MKIEDSDIILAWSITTFIGWMTTAIGYTIPLLPSTVILAWIFLMTVPILLTFMKLKGNNSNRLFSLWSILTVVLLVQNYVTSGFQVFSYYTVWMLGVALAYIYTYGKVPPLSEKTYFYGAIANIAAIPLLYLIPLKYFAVLASLAQAGPVFYDWVKIHR